MHRSLRTALAIPVGALFALCASAETVVLHNARVYTPIGDTVREYSGLVVEDGRISRLLEAGTALPTGSGIHLIDAGGKTVLPGLIDAHGHVLGEGQLKSQADLRGSESPAAAVARVRQFAAANPADRWVIGQGWNQVLWPGKQFPTAADLDAAVSDRPAMLSRVDGHAVWVNSRALAISGINRATPDPQGGQIVRDRAGEATGVLVDSAISLVDKHVPAPTDADLQRFLRVAMAELAALGLTGVHDAGISIRDYEAYRALGQSQQLPIRVYAMLSDSESARAVIAQGPKPAEFDDRLQMRAVKAWVDGALGSRGATMLQDYSDQPHHRGLALYTPEQIATLAGLTSGKGWQLNIHAIGDAGNRLTLDTFEHELTPALRASLRPRIEHAQVIALDDIPRFARLGVIASIQPTHATSDMNMAEDRVGPQRIRGAYAWRSLLDSGARLAGGSDFPVELANPFLGLYAAVTRQDGEGNPPGGWYGKQKLTREEALRLFTIDAAYASFTEDRVGSLEPGKWADFIIIDRDYFKVPQAEIDDIQVIATYVAGRKVAGH